MTVHAWLALTLLLTAPAPPESWLAPLAAHLDAHPQARAADVYKFVHQGVFGPAHAVSSAIAARAWLDDEIAAIESRPSAETPRAPIAQPAPALATGAQPEPLIEFLADQPRLIRVNLRPFLAAHGDRARLIDAFVASAARVAGDPAVMRSRLDAAVALLGSRNQREFAQDLRELAIKMADAGYPAIHHSERYVAAYHPAYRVVLAALLPESR